MKKKKLLLLLIGICAFTFTQAQTYVKHDASGANDGSSWENAYTDLSTALENTTTGDIWVAAGTYKPGSGTVDTMARFAITENINLYGGFDGTESELDDRDPEANLTHLDGDLSGDDTDDDFENNKIDNVLHVVYVDSLLTGVTIDGFTISGGHHHQGNADLDFYYRAGGGIYANSPVQINQCVLRQNYGRSGGAVVTNGIETSGSMITNSDFENNFATGSGILFLWNQANTTVENCNFRNNTTNRGSVYPNQCANITITGCVIENNINPTGYSGGMWSWQTTGLMVTDCTFEGNSGTNAGAFYVDGRDIETPSSLDVVFTNCDFINNAALIDGAAGWGGAGMFWNAGFTMIGCTFEGNTAFNAGALYLDQRDYEAHQSGIGVIEDCTFSANGANLGDASSGRGGAIYGWKSSFTVTGSTFENNEVNSTGGAIYATGDSKTYSIEDCTFDGNSAGWGGGITNYGADTFVDIIDCDFSENSATTSGGAVSNGFLAEVAIEGSTFSANTAQFGAAIFNQNDTTALTVLDCDVIGNIASETGGGINSSGKIAMDVTNTLFEGNQADVGGGITITENDVDGTHVTVTDCHFNLNSATQGAGLNISNVDTDVTSCLFSVNISEDPGTGAGMSINASDSTDLLVNVTNSTFVLNFGALSAGIASWEGGESANSVLNLQNNIFHNPGYSNFAVEDGAPETVSLGGNFSSDDSLNDMLTHEKDISGDGNDPMFVDEDDEDYHLAAGSPCIDAGVNDGAPETDLDGNPRIGDVDMGAFEYDPTSSTKETVVDNNGQLKIAPNPAVHTIEVILNNDWAGTLRVSIVNGNGQVVQNMMLTKLQAITKENIDVTNLPSGQYNVLVNDGTKVLTSSFVKL